MTLKPRHLVAQLSKRLAESKPLIQVVLGPRQVGKTTAVKMALDGRGVYQTADSPVPLPSQSLIEWWEEAEQSHDKILAIDEIQKIPGWSEVLKKLWDARPGIKVIVTGSSALLVERGLKETLSGRFELIRAEHWNLDEASKTFGLSLDEFIEFGCYPGAVPFREDIARWGAYIRDSIVEPAIGRDILQLRPVEHPALLRQVFGVACSLPAQVVSLQKIQGSLEGKGNIATIAGYLDLLHQGFLITALQKYSGSAVRIRQSSPKFVVHDNGLIRAFERPIEPRLEGDRIGRYLENAVGARLIEAGWEVYYWKHRNLEVDYVALGPGGEKWAIEVKSSQPTDRDLVGLRQFVEDHPAFEPVLVSPKNCTIANLKHVTIEKILSLSGKTLKHVLGTG